MSSRGTCDGKTDCPRPIAYLDEKGYVYCSPCGVRLSGSRRSRKLRKWEIEYIRAGKPLPSYEPRPKPREVSP